MTQFVSWSRSAGLLVPVLLLAACAPKAAEPAAKADSSTPAVTEVAIAPGSAQQVAYGRDVVIQHDCSGCHGGTHPGDKGWLAGVMSPLQEFQIGACSFANPKAKPCFVTRPRNLTPDDSTGLGRFTERQIFNALRFGLRPETTPDVEITGSTPGQGNFPENPHYLAVPMPWPSWRHMPDKELWAIAAYLKRGLKPFANKVAESDGPPDFWASAYTVDKIGPYPVAAFPTANEKGQ
ncbi:MAG: hypothetical protein V4558_05775 [Gemmatimonadota bacterium]